MGHHLVVGHPIFKDHLVVNAIVPYLWYLGEREEDDRMYSLAEEELRKMRSEDNGIVKKWRSLGVKLKSAYDSQSLLALYRYYCNAKKCLSCEAGNKVLNRAK